MLREAIESGNEQLRSGLRPVPRFSMAGSHWGPSWQFRRGTPRHPGSL